MAPFKRIALATLVAITLTVPAAAEASLASRFGADAAGVVVVPRISELASRIAGRPVIVHCYPDGGVDDLREGYTPALTDPVTGVVTLEPVIFLNGDLCGSLWTAMNWRGQRDWLRNWWTTSQAVGAALLVLEHEAMHVRLQSLDEGLVECTAFQNVWPMLVSLRLPRWFRVSTWDGIEAAHANTAEQYRAVC